MPKALIPLLCALLAPLALSCGHRSILLPGPDGGQRAANAPDDAGMCPPPQSVCGSGVQARCQATDRDPANCGVCGHACTPGIACVAGVCQQHQCAGPVAFHEIGRYPSHLRVSDTGPRYYYLGADLNRDGRLDLIEHNDAGDLVLWLGQGDGSFIVSDGYATEGSADTPALLGYAAVADFDEDGLMDLLVSTKNGTAIALRPGLPGGGFGGPAGVPTGRLTIGDFDGDGHLDTFLPRPDADGYFVRFTVMRGRGDGTFAEAASYVPANDKVHGYTVQDWDGNGTLDLIAIGTAVHLFLGNGDGTFGSEQRCALAFWYGVLADLNQDGKLDLVWTLGQGPRLATSFGSGGCGFSPRKDYELSKTLGIQALPSRLGLGDLSGDGFLDLVVETMKEDTIGASWTFGAAFLFGDGHGAFTVERFPDGAIGQNTFVADVTGDGRADIVAADFDIKVFSNTCER